MQETTQGGIGGQRRRNLFATLGIGAFCAAVAPGSAMAEASTLHHGRYPGTLQVAVDATDLAHKVFRVAETVPVHAGPVTLVYPKWLPGTHGPIGSVVPLAGLHLRAGGVELPWLRDPLDPNAFRVDVPRGVSQLDVAFDLLTPVDDRSGRVQMTPDMLSLEWIQLVLYPSGWRAADVQVQASVTLPAGWGQGSALEVAAQDGATLRFRAVDFDTLADSPMVAGRWFKRIDLDPGAVEAGRAPVWLDLVTDRPELILPSDEQLAAHRALVTQADRLYASRHYAHYDFLVSVTDQLGGIGLEHHQSSEDGVRPTYFTEWSKDAIGRDLLPHEYTHSWNGKFRRPADLATPNFNVPMQGSLLWVYEGQTQFWGHVLAARAGIVSQADARDSLALTAAALDARAGRSWRNLQDTTNEAVMGARRVSKDWSSWQRGSDYYEESRLVWLEADMLIRSESHGQRSLDDFARSFFGVQPGRVEVLPYTFDDVVRALDAVQPHDWAHFLRERLDGHGPGAPLAGLERAGWRLAWSDKPSDYWKAREARAKVADFSDSLGFDVGAEGRLGNVLWDGPAFRAGLVQGGSLLAVNGRAYKADVLKDAVTAMKAGAPPVALLVKMGDSYRTYTIDYRGGLRYPQLERIPGAPDLLSALYAPK